MGRQEEKIEKKREAIQEAQDNPADASSKAVSFDFFDSSRQISSTIESENNRIIIFQDREKFAKKVKTIEDQLEKLECAMEEKEKNSEIALGTSKLNYLDPRITVSWCRKNEVPIEKMNYP